MRKQAIGRESSATRALLLDAAEALMREEGYAAVTSRKLGARAGVRAQLVHYYFPSMDDLFLSLFRGLAERRLKATAEAMKSENPWLELWKQGRDAADTALNLEFTALANHRKAVRSEIARVGEELRRLQHDALLASYKARGIEPAYPPGVVALIIASIGQQIAVEAEMGIGFAHAETAAIIDETLGTYFSSGHAKSGPELEIVRTDEK